MASLRLRLCIIVITMILFTWISYIFGYNNTLAKQDNYLYLKSIPLRIEEWEGKNIELEKNVYQILETREIIHRNYFSRNNVKVLLSIVHYADAKVDFHSPEACLGGLGQNVQKKVRTVKCLYNGTFYFFKVAELTSNDQNRNYLSYYFYQSGNSFNCNYILSRLTLAYNKMFNDDVSASLIRITTVFSGSKYEANKLLDQFLKDLFPVLLNHAD